MTTPSRRTTDESALDTEHRIVLNGRLRRATLRSPANRTELTRFLFQTSTFFH